MSLPVRVGLTGGIGSGKSTVASLLAEAGAGVVDTDAIARDLTTAEGVAMPQIALEFGAQFLTPAGALARDKMRGLVFADAGARQRLEAIIHPLVALETQKQADIFARLGRCCIVFDVPLLVESPSWRQRVDHVLVVDCTPEVQIKRVMARNQLTQPEVENILASQTRRTRRLCAADSVIFNATLTFDELAGEVRQIATRFGLSFK
jgi:dephospho-CoA kinase